MRKVTFIDDWIQEGIEQGIEQGMEQGIEQGRVEGTVQTRRKAILQILWARFNLSPQKTKPLEQRLETIGSYHC